jgi:mannose-6-phosphate isomerase-like protein (cupin superfamily)
MGLFSEFIFYILYIEKACWTMIVTRWQAPNLPTIEQAKLIFSAEGLSPSEENLPPQTNIPDHRHPFDEVRMVVEGRLILNISGNQILLRPGDRINIPANTRHSKSTQKDEGCLCVIASRTY